MLKNCLLILFILCTGIIHAQSWTKLQQEAITLYNQKNYQAALPVAEKAVEAAVLEFGVGHANHINSLNLTAIIWKQSGKPETAASIWMTILRNREKFPAPETPELASVYQSFGLYYGEMGVFDKADSLIALALDIRRKLLGSTNISTLNSLLYLSSIHREMQRFHQAEMEIMEALGNCASALGESHPLTFAAGAALGRVYMESAQYEKAEPLFMMIKRTYESYHLDSLPGYAKTLEDLGAYYVRIGIYDNAVSYYLKALENKRKFRGEKSPTLSSSLYLLAEVYLKQKEYGKAEQALKMALSLNRHQPGVNDAEYGKALNNLGFFYMNVNRDSSALQLLVVADSLITKQLGINHAAHMSNLINIASVYTKMKQFGKAEKVYQELLPLFSKRKGSIYLQYLKVLNYVAEIYIETGQWRKADSVLRVNTSLIEKSLGTQHEVYLSTLDLRIRVAEKMQNYKEEISLMIDRTRNGITNLMKVFTILSEEQKRSYVAAKVSLMEMNNSFIYLHPEQAGDLIEMNFGLATFLKSMTLADTRNMIDYVRKSKIPDLKKIVVTWDSLNLILSREFTLPYNKRRADLDSIKQMAEMYEKTLNMASTKLRNQEAAFFVSITDWARALKKEEAVIEFVRFKIYNDGWTDSVMYAAYISKKDRPIQFIPLFEERQLQRIIDSAGKQGESAINSLYRGLELKNKNVNRFGAALYKLIWQPMESSLHGMKYISYSPTGKLNTISLSAIPTDSTHFLLDKYQMRQYSSTREILKRLTPSQVKPQNIALFGNAAFTMDSLSIAQHKKTTKASSIGISSAQRGMSGSWNDLPGTENEIQKIKSLFERNKTIVSFYNGSMASEENLKALNGRSPGIIHIATHGFFLPAPSQSAQTSVPGEENNFSLADDPLLRTGLVLSGGNYAWSGKTPIEGSEDGIVTAYEISKLDLSNTELVVVSACETGLGDIKGSEGVFGLQRAFKMAGVKNMIVSLWQVPDKETAELMSSFYSYWIRGKAINESFQQAQTDMRKKYPPFYWAAFVLIE